MLVEGPVDALAVTLAGHGRYVGVAPLGTSLTDDQAHQLATLSARPVIATDADLPGRLAAERAYWLLTQHGSDPLSVELPNGSDPASVLHTHGPAALQLRLENAHPLARDLIEERLANLHQTAGMTAAAAVTAASPPATWAGHLAYIAERLGADPDDVADHLRTAVTDWNRDPAAVAAGHTSVADVRARLEMVRNDPTRRWAAHARDLDPRLTSEADWPALALMMQNAEDAGHDIATITTQLVADTPLAAMPAQDLRYRLAGALPAPQAEEPQPASASTTDERRHPIPGFNRPAHSRVR